MSAFFFYFIGAIIMLSSVIRMLLAMFVKPDAQAPIAIIIFALGAIIVGIGSILDKMK